MADENTDLRCYLTNAGIAAENNSIQLNRSLNVTEMVFGSGFLADEKDPREQTAMIKEEYAVPCALLFDEDTPTLLVFKGDLPADVGGFYINEVGIRLEDGTIYGYARGKGDYKPTLEQGATDSVRYAVEMYTTNANIIETKIDLSTVYVDWEDLEVRIAAHKAEDDPHPQYPLAVNAVYGQNATRTTQINEASAQGALMSGFWTVYTNNNLNYFPAEKLQYPIHMIKAAYSVVGNKGGLELMAGDSKTSALFFRVSTGIGAGTLQKVFSDLNPPHVSEVKGVQYAPYDSSRIYKCGEICTTEVDGKVLFWEWYSNVEALAGKDPSLVENRQDGWEDDTKPYYWMPHKKARAGTPLFPWFSETIPEGTLNVVGNSVPVAVFWRLAAVFPEFVNADTQMIDFPETRSEFFRVLDQGRGVDTDRVLGSAQEQSIEHHGIQLMGKGSADAVPIGNVVHLGRRGTGADPVGILGYSGLSPTPNQYYDNYAGTPYGNYSDGDDETRPSNLAFPVLVEV
ncbi:hypothetical protein DDN06_00900 [Vibrio cholerae]|nr:hypothetical protein [Vibrio cholerae]